MKKLFLTLATAAVAIAAQATEYTFTVTGINAEAPNTDANPSVTATVTPDIEGFTFSAMKNGGSTNPAFNANGQDLRVYAKGTFIMNIPEGTTVTSVVFNISTAGLKRLAPITADQGTIATQAAGDNTVTWTGDVTGGSISFTVGEKAVYGSDGSSKAGQFDFGTFVVEASSNGPAKLSAGLSFPEAAYYASIGDTFEAPELTKATTAPATYTSSNEEVATVDAGTGAVTIVAAGTTVITATCAANDEYYGGSASYTLTVMAANVVYEGLMSNMDDWTTENINLAEGLSYIWAWDNTYGLKGAAFVGGSAKAGTAYAISPVISLVDRQGSEMTFSHALNQLKTGNRADFCNVYVREAGTETWNDLEISEWPAGSNWTFVPASASLAAYDGKNIQIGFCYSVAEGSTIAPTWEIKNLQVTGNRTPTSVSEAVAIETPARYFNLQGCELSNPAKGEIVIVVKGSKSFKTIIR